MVHRSTIMLARAKYQAQLGEYAQFSNKMGLVQQRERIYYDMRGRVAPNLNMVSKYPKEMISNADRDSKEFRKYKNLLKDTDINLAEFGRIKYNDSRRYELLQGYERAVTKGDIHALTGFKMYEQITDDIEKEIVGITTSKGTRIDSYATHFIDRVIGQTSTSHDGMRLGTPITDIKDALENPVRVSEVMTMKDGDVRQNYFGENASVVISIRDNKLIQATPQKGR